MIRLTFALCSAAVLTATCHAQQRLELDGAVVSFDGVNERYAEAIGHVVASARTVATRSFQFDMPETIHVNISVDPDGRPRLFNDGQVRLTLVVRAEKDLRQPSVSGMFHIYGICHEVGHLAMYRPISDHSWMSYSGSEGWAHFIGSQIVDAVFKELGEELWPDQYDYRSDGSQRLDRQLSAAEQSEVVQCAGLWKEFSEIVGAEQIAAVFAAWGRADVDRESPGESLRESFEAPEDQKHELSEWWTRAEAQLTLKRPRSGFVPETVDPGSLDDAPQELVHDDGVQADKNSRAGSGHGVRFEINGDPPVYVTSVSIFGSRYGRTRAPNEDFKIWLCDENFREIAQFEFAYGKFARAKPKWVSLNTKPTRVPEKFIVCVGFNPTATKGVFVGLDAEASGNSITGLPGGKAQSFPGGDWMIRVNVQRRADRFALMQNDGSAGEAPRSKRKWTDVTGNFTVVAEFIDLADGMVRLKKPDGNIIRVSIDTLSDADQKIARQLGR